MSVQPRSFLLLATTLVMWAAGPILHKYLSFHYDVWTQNAFRYFFGTLFLFLLVGLHKQPLFRLTRSQWLRLALVAAPNFILQTAIVLSQYFIYPSVAGLVSRSQVIVLLILSVILFHDERRVIRMANFWIGTALALAGVVVVIVGRDPTMLARLDVSQSRFWIGIGLVLVHAFFLACYSIGIKRVVRDIDPFVAYTHVSWMTGLAYVVMLATPGAHPSDVWHGPLLPFVVIVISGPIMLSVAHVAYYAALRHIKLLVVMTVMQLQPVLTCLFSAFFFHDLLSPLQIAGGLAVLAGAWLAGLVQLRIHHAEAPCPD